MSALFSPYVFRDVTLRNRIVISPMCQYAAEDGQPNAWHLMHLLNLSISGAGLLFIEGTSVTPEGRITPGDLGLWGDAQEAAFRPVMAAIRQHSKIPVMVQIAHAGRKGSSHVPWQGGAQIPQSEGGWQTPAPSAIAHKPGETPPAALNEAGMAEIKQAFVEAALRVHRLGMDGLEIHGAHGYLIHEFLSPIANQRNDAYGGSLENRMRYPLEIFDAVRAAFPDRKPVGVKVSATDWVEGGWDLPQTIEFAKALKQRGADWITASSGGTSPLQKIPLSAGYQVPFATGIKNEAGITAIAVGLITEPQQADDIISSGKADLVTLARAMLYDPRWPWHAAATLGATVDAPPQYWRSQPRGLGDLFGDTSFGFR